MQRLLIAAVALAWSAPSQGFGADLPVPADSNYWFVRTHALVGLSHAAGSFLTLPPGSISSEQTSYDPQENYGAGIGIGYQWAVFGVPVRAVFDGSVNFRHDTDVEAEFPDEHLTYANDLRIWDARLSLLADVFSFGAGSIYFGGGIGGALLESDVSIPGTGRREKNREWKVSPSVEVGLRLDRAFARIQPELSYRFRWFGDTESGEFPTGEKLAYSNANIHEVMLGFTMPLDATDGAVAKMQGGGRAAGPAAGSFDWTGYYAGAFGGWGWSNAIDVTELATSAGASYNPDNVYTLNGNGITAGAQIGVDWQWRWLVLGLGAEGGWLDLDDSVVDPQSSGNDTVTSLDTDWYGAVTARAGLAYDRLLVFGRVGAAYLKAEARTDDSCTAPPCGASTVKASVDDSYFGWTAGAGVEVALSRHWTVGTEYRFTRFFDCLQPSGEAVPGGAVTQSVADGGIDGVQTVRAQVNYRW